VEGVGRCCDLFFGNGAEPADLVGLCLLVVGLDGSGLLDLALELLLFGLVLGGTGLWIKPLGVLTHYRYNKSPGLPLDEGVVSADLASELLNRTFSLFMYIFSGFQAENRNLALWRACYSSLQGLSNGGLADPSLSLDTCGTYAGIICFRG
jgi:hypothetical protein